MASPALPSQQEASAPLAGLHAPPTPAYSSPVAPNPPLPQADPMMPALAPVQAVIPIPNVPITSPGSPLVAPATPTPVDFLPSYKAVAPATVAQTDIEPTIYVSAEGDGRIDEANPTLTVLPGYFEVIASGDPVKDPIGTRKKLYALNSNPDFGIARPTNDQGQIANFIPLHSKRVSRSVEKQGKVVYDFHKGTYSVFNFADPTHPDIARRCNPIRLEGRSLMPNEEAEIRDGDRILVGGVMLRFHIEGRATAVGISELNGTKPLE